ncbi:MAG: Hsp20/alpha crystallin family protein [Patescibacteria group bacterium]|jgi:HSP20 family protein
MRITPWRPLFPEMFEDEFWGEQWHFSPAIDVYEDGDTVIIQSPIAGIDPKLLKIEIEENVLKLSGEMKKQSEIDEKNYYRKEVRQGSFSRAVALPHAVDADRANATYKDGVLMIQIPKREEMKPKSVTVNVEEQ